MTEYKQALESSMELENIDLLVEEFYDGHEMDIDILVQHNKPVFIGLTDNFKPHEPYFFETGNVCPSIELNKDEKRAIERIIGEWIPKLNLQNGLLHFEVFSRPISLYPNRKYDIERPFENIHEFLMPIEMNLRLGGVATWSLNYAAYGVDLLTSHIHLMLGLDLDQSLLNYKQTHPKAQCISHHYFPLEVPCRIRSISVEMETVEKSDKIVEIGLFKASGDSCDKSDFIGWMAIKTAVTTTNAELLATSSKCSSLIKYEFSNDCRSSQSDNRLISTAVLSSKQTHSDLLTCDNACFIFDVFANFDQPKVDSENFKLRYAEKNGVISLLKDHRLYYLNAKEAHDYSLASNQTNSYEDKSILMIGCGKAIAQSFDLNGKKNYKSKVLLLNKNATAFTSYFDDTIHADVNSKEETLRIVRTYIEEKNIKFDAIMTFYEGFVQIAAYLAGQLGCLGIPFDVTTTIQNKYEFRKYCEQVGIVTPRYSLIKSDQRSKQIDFLNSYGDYKSKSGEDTGSINELDRGFMQMFMGSCRAVILKNPNGKGKGMSFVKIN
jgi:hypothetical protein